MIYTTELLTEMLALHLKWLRGEECGKRFEVESGTNLSGANLYRANLSDANLYRANLSGANLSGTNLSGANLSRANLSDTNLYRANLSDANLSDTNLSGANLSDTNLSDANLSGADWAVCPEEGAFIGWKKVRGDVILKLEILADAKRVSTPIGRKCRADKVRVLEAFTIDGLLILDGREHSSKHDFNFVYRVGEVAEVENFDDSITIECTSGLHFFITRKEACEYN